MLEEVFSTEGEVADIYYPMDLAHGCKPRGFAFVRFLSREDRDRAVQRLNGAHLGVGRDIIVTVSQSRSYFNQDESK